MGTICILLGLIIFFVFVLVGWFGANALIDMYTKMFALQNEGAVLAIIIGAFVFIGFLICLSLVMHGLTYNKINKLYSKLGTKKHSKRRDI